MNLNWYKKKLTIMIIPEVNRSVVRLRVPNMYALAAMAILSIMLLLTGVLYGIHKNNARVTSDLKHQLEGTRQKLKATMATKDEAIDQLQNGVIELSQQMKAQVEEIKKLEHDVFEITRLDPPAEEHGKRLAETANNDSKTVPVHSVGGAMIPVSQEEMLQLGRNSKYSLLVLDEQIKQLRTSLAETKQRVESRQKLLRATPTIWPTTSRTISSPFGYRKDPFTNKPSFHAGLDIAARVNEPVYSTADGTVVTAASDQSRGNYVIIEHSKGLRTWYLHLNKLLVKSGDRVHKGDTIGLLGSTGRSTGPHLHYEVMKNGVRIDPEPYLQTTRKE